MTMNLMQLRIQREVVCGAWRGSARQLGRCVKRAVDTAFAIVRMEGR
jgi:hypothetical protein